MSKLTIVGSSKESGVLGSQCYALDDILIDCGIGMVRRDGVTRSVPPELATLAGRSTKIKAGLLTHSHLDHIGALPILARNNLIDLNAKIWATPQTCNVSFDVCKDSVQHTDLYDEGDFLLMPDFSPIAAPGEFEVLPGQRAWAFPNGHLNGSSGFVFRLKSGKNALVMGDWCSHDQPIVKGMLPVSEWPEEWIPDMVIASDWTYGLSSLEAKRTFASEAARMRTVIRHRFEQGMFIRVFVFANGKMQNVARILADEFRSIGVPIYIDGRLGKKVWKTYRDVQWSDRDVPVPALGEQSGIYEVEGRRHREELMNAQQPNIIITSPGMGDVGLGPQYLQASLPRRDHFVASSSFLAEGSNLYELERLLDGHPRYRDGDDISFSVTSRNKEQEEEAVLVPMRAEYDHFGLSAHNGPADNLAFLDALIERRGGAKLERYGVGHGAPEARAMGAQLVRHYVIDPDRNVIDLAPGTVIDLD